MRFMREWSLASRYARRALRQGIGGFGIFLVCLVLGLGAIVAVGTLSQAIGEHIQRNAKALLGGDIAVTIANREASLEEVRAFQQLGEVSRITEMRAMLFAGENSTLTELKAVDNAYPLVGELTIEQPDGSEKYASSALQQGALVEEGLLARLGVAVGDNLQMGTAEVAITGVLGSEPDRIVNTFAFGPRVMVSMDTLRKTGLLQSNSLADHRYRILLADGVTSQAAVDALESQFPESNWRVMRFEEENPSVEENLDQLQFFLSLAGLSALLLGGVGIASAARNYVHKQQKAIATLKSLGASQSLVFKTYLLIIAGIAMLGVGVAILAGVGLAYAIAPVIQEIIPLEQTVLIYPEQMLRAMWFGLCIVLLFSLPALFQAMQTKPASIFRAYGADSHRLTIGQRITQLSVLAVLTGSLWWDAGEEWRVTIGFVLASVVAFVVFYGLSRFLQWGARRIHAKRPLNRLALANLYRPDNPTTHTVLSLGIGVTVLISLVLVEGNLQKRITETIPQRMPSLFVIDIQSYQHEGFMKVMKSMNAVTDIQSVPIVRGSVTQVKNVPIEEVDVDESVDWVTERERGFTSTAAMPENVRLTEGQWWPEDYSGPLLVSMDQRVARGLGMQLGDTISVSVLGQERTATLASMRKVNYASMQINFAMMFSPGFLEDMPHQFVATARIPDEAQESGVVNAIAREYPTISVIQVRKSLEQVSEIIGYISLALKVTIALVLLTGFFVLAGALIASQEQRMMDMIVLKVIGARRKQLLQSYLLEWFWLGTATLVLSAGLGMAGAVLILKRFRAETFYAMPDVVLQILAVTLALLIAISLAINARIFGVRPADYLRNE